MSRSFLFGLFISSFLFGCDKEQVPQPSIQVSDISFRYDPAPKDVKEFNFILSQEDGKVVLDTLLAPKVDHLFKVKSINTKFDVTTIFLNPADNKYTIKTYVQVAPTNWYLKETGAPFKWSESENSKLTYTNLPPYDPGFNFITKDLGTWRTEWSGSTLSIVYNRLLPVDVAYLLLPKSGKYILTELTSAQTIVDFSKASNTGKRKFSKPEGITNFTLNLYGFTKIGDYNKFLRLYGDAVKMHDAYDLQFPETGIDDFDLQVQYKDNSGGRHLYTYAGATIPQTIDFASKTDFTVTKSTSDDFQITFEQDKPIIYTMLWTSADDSFKVDWNIFSSPDKPSFAPSTFLKNIKSKLLQSKDVSTIKLMGVTTQKAKDYTYQTFLDYQANPSARGRREMKEQRKISKTFTTQAP